MPANQFVWYELVTSDIDAALSFYGTVIGWEGRDFPGGNERYVILNAKSKGVGGVMALPDGMTQPFWMGYVGTADIDSAVAKFTSSGGNVHRGPWNIPNVGRLALVTDPQGIGLALIQGSSDQPSQAFDQRLPGHGNWNELHTTDPDRAFAFYAEQFGWTKGETVNMGAIGIYQIFKADDARSAVSRRRRSRCSRPGSIISEPRASTSRPDVSGPQAARFCMDRAKCRGVHSSFKRRTRKAQCTRWSVQHRDDRCKKFHERAWRMRQPIRLNSSTRRDKEFGCRRWVIGGPALRFAKGAG